MWMDDDDAERLFLMDIRTSKVIMERVSVLIGGWVERGGGVCLDFFCAIFLCSVCIGLSLRVL